jgi:8-oxo-dGTP diphosphatase
MKQLNTDEQCSHCGRFDNRGVSIDAVIAKDNKLLLIKRGLNPFKDFWALPGGYVSWDESVEDTVKREIKEETNLDVSNIKLIGVYSLPERHPKQVINIAFLAEKVKGYVKVGDDALDFKWFSLDQLPDKLAFDHHEIIKDAKCMM